MPKMYRREELKSMSQALTKRHAIERQALFEVKEGDKREGIVKRDGPFGDLYIPAGGIKVHIPDNYRGKRIWPGYIVTYHVTEVYGDSANASIVDA
jgi:hypothetical protein